MLEVEEEIGSEDEVAFTQVIKEDEEMNNVGQLHEEATTTIQRMKVLLKIRREERKRRKRRSRRKRSQTPGRPQQSPKKRRPPFFPWRLPVPDPRTYGTDGDLGLWVLGCRHDSAVPSIRHTW